MAQSHLDPDHHEEPPQATGEEVATRLFSIVMLGTCATILFMVVMANY